MRGNRRHSSQSLDSPLPEAFVPCPIRTKKANLDCEREIKCYKLGKKRWSYNQCALVIKNAASGDSMEVVDCMQYGPNPLSVKEQESGVTYQVRLVNGLRVRVNVFVVYNHPREVETEDGEIEYEWPSISRCACPKDHCEGPILRTIQRFGKLGRRSGKGNENTMKDTKYMFISIDEAGSHVRVKHFRLLAAMYPIGETTALSTTMSGPIRVLANNDVPSGAAFIPLVLETHETWEGWRASIDVQPRMPDGMHTEDNPDFSVSLSSMDTENANTSTTLGSGSAGTAKSDPQTAAIRDLLKVHASEYCQDLDFGAARFCENYNRAVGMIADPPPFDIKDEPKLHLDEDVMAYHDRKLAAQGFTPVTYSLSANACAYNSPELSHRSNNDTIYLSSPEMQNAQYVTLPQLATTLPHGFQMPQSDDMELPFEDWYDHTLGEPALMDNGFIFTYPVGAQPQHR